MHPFLVVGNAAGAGHMLGVIRRDTNVQALAQQVAVVYPAGGNPFANEVFLAAYSNALVSVAERLTVTPPLALGFQAAAQAPEPPVGQRKIDLDWVAIVGKDQPDSKPTRTNELKPAFRFNTLFGEGFWNVVDWVAEVREVDVAAAFPGGRDDFNLRFPPRAARTTNTATSAVEIPLRPGYLQERYVAAELLSARVNPLEFLLQELGSALTDLVPNLNTAPFVLPPQDGMYLMRAVGPRLTLSEEFFFARTHLTTAHNRALAINLVNAVMDTICIFIDVEGSVFREVLPEVILEALRKAPAIRSVQDAGVAILELGVFTLGKVIENVADNKLKTVLNNATRALSKVSKVTRLLEALDKLSSAGQFAERVSGMSFATTPIESALLTVGDPFKLQIISVTPSSASPGDAVLIVIRNARFDRANPKDQVIFVGLLGPRVIPVEATADVPGGDQQLTFRLPNTEFLYDGRYDVYVLARGRNGQTTFTVAARPTVTGMTQQEGFAATDDFLGARFDGTPVTITGFGFGREDRFVFGGGIEATNKSGGSGSVTVRVPAGAISGRIRILRQVATNEVREGLTGNFQVLGPPVIVDMSPGRGPVGTMINFQTRNLGTIADSVKIRFGNFAPSNVNFGEFSGDVLGIPVPLALAPTNEMERSVTVSVLTPAGRADRTFVVEAGRAPGGVIQVGGASVVTLARAMAFAAGTAVPLDDRDFIIDPDMTVRQLDPPYEEGDFVTDHRDEVPRFPVGAQFADRIVISGVVPGGVTLSSEHDTLSGEVIAGPLTITGAHNTNTVTVRDSSGHGLVLLGDHNTLNVTCESNSGDGLRLEGGAHNLVRLTARANRGNGITITGGARANRLFIQTGVLTNLTQVVPGSGNRGHGVLFTGDARDNVLQALGTFPVQIGAAANTGDGVRIEGPNVINNVLSNGLALRNGSNGITVTGGASNNVIRFNAHSNQRHGIALINGAGGPPRRTLMDAGCGDNGEYGILISDVTVDESIRLGSPRFFVSGSGNRHAGARLEGVTTGLRCGFSFHDLPTAVIIEGRNVTNNVIDASARNCSGNGVVITNTQRNVFILNVLGCAGHGAIVSAADDNEIRGFSSLNGQDGLALVNGSRGNSVSGFYNFNANGLSVRSGAHDNQLLDLLSARNFGHGLLLTGEGTANNQVLRAQIGLCEIGGRNEGDGILIENGASANFIGHAQGEGAWIRNSKGAGIRLSGAGTQDNEIRGCVIDRHPIGDFLAAGGGGECKPTIQSAGIIVDDGAEGVFIGGPNPAERNFITGHEDGIVVRAGARRVFIQNNLIATNESRGVAVEDAAEVLVGRGDGAAGNEFFDQPVGIELRGPATTNCIIAGNRLAGHSQTAVALRDGAARITLGTANIIVGNGTGVTLAGARQNELVENSVTDNTNAGVRLELAAADHLLRGNTIHRNGVGVVIDGAATVRNTLRDNSITAHSGKGIELSGGGNGGRAAPMITSFAAFAATGATTAPDDSVVEVFQDPDAEGRIPVGLGRAFGGRFHVPVTLPAGYVDTVLHLTATVTDPAGNTSEFGTATNQPLAPVAQIAFTSNRDGNAEIYLADGFTAAPTRLTTHPAGDFSPALSADGGTLLFVSRRDGNAEIYSMSPAGGAAPNRLTIHPAEDTDPAWGPGASNVVFVSERDGNPEIYRMNADGTGVVRLTNDGAEDRHPTVAPDGSRIAFASNRRGAWEIVVMDANGSNVHFIATNAAPATRPAWSPDGQRLAFVSAPDGADLYVVRPDGTDLTRVTSHTAVDTDPAWMPGGERLVFASNRDEGLELYFVPRHGGTPARFTVSRGENTEPSTATR
jgi:TolB protein